MSSTPLFVVIRECLNPEETVYTALVVTQQYTIHKIWIIVLITLYFLCRLIVFRAVIAHIIAMAVYTGEVSLNKKV